MAALDALNQLQYPKVAEAISMGMNDKSPRMRASAIGLMNKIDLAPAMLAQMVSDLMKKGNANEQQRVIK